MKRHDYGERWDDSDVDYLLECIDEGRTHAWIAERMGRTVAAVRSKLYRLRS